MCGAAPTAGGGDGLAIPLDTRPFRGRGGAGDASKVRRGRKATYCTSIMVARGRSGTPRQYYAIALLCNCTPIVHVMVCVVCVSVWSYRPFLCITIPWGGITIYLMYWSNLN